MKPGPRKTPTTLQNLRGNPGKRAKNKREAIPKAGLPTAPDELSDEAKRVWADLGAKLEMQKLITPLDAMPFAILCEAYAMWRHLIAEARGDGPIVKMNGQLVPNPYLAEAKKQGEIVRKLMGEFGLSPASRARVEAGGSDAEVVDPLSELIGEAESASMRIA